MGTRVTIKGQVTIPKGVRDRLGIRPGDEVEFVEEDGRVALQKSVRRSPFDKWHGYLKGVAPGKSTDELIREMRGE